LIYGSGLQLAGDMDLRGRQAALLRNHLTNRRRLRAVSCGNSTNEKRQSLGHRAQPEERLGGWGRRRNWLHEVDVTGVGCVCVCVVTATSLLADWNL